ncbi:MAG: hypothetical protein L0099_14340 [Acidobacteria bacterium]|nr:hypothetical protein [Acidobacteriota bacterium]
MRTIFISSAILLTILWALGFGLLTAYAAVLSFFRILMPRPQSSPQQSAIRTQRVRTAEERL